MQLNPAHLGMQFHKLNAARDPNFCSLRVNPDIRLIVRRSADNRLRCYVDPDAASPACRIPTCAEHSLS